MRTAAATTTNEGKGKDGTTKTLSKAKNVMRKDKKKSATIRRGPSPPDGW